MKKVIKEILVEEWYTKEGDSVYQHLRFQNGEEWKRLSPYKEIPWVELKLPKYITNP